MNFRIFILLLFFVTSLHAQNWIQSQEKTKVGFKIKNFGVNVDGSFQEVKILTNFSQNNLDESSISAKIPVKSIETGIKGRDEHLLKEDYFNKNEHKLITLKSTKIKKEVDGSLILFADLTIKGITKKIEVPLQVEEASETIKLTSFFTLNRKDFDVGGGSFILSKKVKVEVEYVGTKKE